MGATIRAMQPRLVLSVGNFFSAGHYFLIVYILVPYLATMMSPAYTGLVISLGAVVTLLAFPLMPGLVARYGARYLAIALAFLQATVLLLLAVEQTVWGAVMLVALACAFSPLIAYQLDLLLEATMAKESMTGRIRAAFLTAGNSALIIAPLAIGFILDGTETYGLIFIAAAATLAPFIALFTIERLHEGEAPRIHSFFPTCHCIWKDVDLRAAALGNAVLQLFYHLAPFYIPLYLHTALGIPWSDLGWMFAVMLLPFVVLEYPAGWIADKWLGDKELLFVGFAIMGLSFAAVAFITIATPLLIILLILVATRIGAALVESMIEIHFFRRVSERDANTVSIFRMTRPLAALTAPALASVALLGGSYAAFFIGAGLAVTVLGVLATIAIHDIR